MTRLADTFLKVLGGIVLLYLTALLAQTLVLIAFGQLSIDPKGPTTWFWECRQREVRNTPYFPTTDLVGRAPDQAKCQQVISK